MKRGNLTAVLVGLAVIVSFADAASAMHHPTLGRFMQRDPAGYVDGMNLYQCVGGNPVTRVDPSGLAAETGTGSLFAVTNPYNPNRTAPPTADKLSAALKSICRCFDYVRAAQGDGIRLGIRVWKAERGVLPYDPSSDSAKQRFCQCIQGDGNTDSKDQAKKLAEIERLLQQGRYGEATANANAIGGKGLLGSCLLVYTVLAKGTMQVAWHVTAGILGNPNGSLYGWDPEDSGGGPAYMKLAHEMVHYGQGIGGGMVNEAQVVGMENRLRYEHDVAFRSEHGTFGGKKLHEVTQKVLVPPSTAGVDKLLLECGCRDKEKP